MTKAYIDSASIHSALSALLIGPKRLAESPWERQGLLETTYLLMHANVHIIPGLGQYLGPSGPYEYVLEKFPQLEELPPPDHRKAAGLTKNWAARNPGVIREALDALTADPVKRVYCNNAIECFWPHHVQMYGALFNREFISQSASVLGCSQGELQRICDLTADAKRVEGWIRDGRRGDEAALAERAYWLGTLLRGRLHEHLAKGLSLQLVAHPIRRPVQLDLPDTGPGKPVLRSEELLARMLIGAALQPRSPEQRVQSWIESVRKARDAVLTGAVALPQTVLETRAEAYAITAAKTIGIAGHSKVLARTIDATASLGFPVLVALTVSPWLGAIGPVATQTYRYFAGASVGDQLAQVARSTRSHFRALARMIPGRIERHLRSG